jgi:hypothetical protein
MAQSIDLENGALKRKKEISDCSLGLGVAKFGGLLSYHIAWPTC